MRSVGLCEVCLQMDTWKELHVPTAVHQRGTTSPAHRRDDFRQRRPPPRATNSGGRALCLLCKCVFWFLWHLCVFALLKSQLVMFISFKYQVSDF